MSDLTKRGLPRLRVAPGATLEERILLHTDRSGDCWVWTATIDSNGYGRLTINKKLRYAHRISYTAFVGPIAGGMEIDHLCRNRACCNPAHLDPVTPRVNNLRGMAPGARARRRDRCFYGVHLYDEHAYYTNQGRRACRECQRIYASLWKQIPHAERMRRKRSGEKVVDLAAHYALISGERAA